MNKVLKQFLLGLLVWAVPFVSSFFVWDMEANAPSIGQVWFNAIMALMFAIGFSIAAYLYFRNIRRYTVKEGLITGVVWYAELLLMDLIFLVGIFKMSIAEYLPMVVTYLNAFILCVMIGYVKKK